jgi:hypothetical protein
MRLAVTTFLLGNENLVSDAVKRVSCKGVIADVIDIVDWDLEIVRQANADTAKPIDTFRTHILERLN